ncbi:MAG: ketosamine-3-kinase [Gammaproteobacteria bacterium]|nr:MAG: ketosamine-3-kinase [Pseudomonadota bacterium]PIE38156.1 MAG: ketosamine-3-kinase [Gammaproteobacteria bacterium]
MHTIIEQAWDSSRFSRITAIQPVSGGCINQAWQVNTESGNVYFVKTHHSPPQHFFAREAEGIQAMANTGTLRCPEVCLVTDSMLVLNYIPPHRPGVGSWTKFGKLLARMHGQPASRFGFEHDNHCGLTRQINTWNTSGYAFFAESRLGYQAKMACDNKRITNRLRDKIEALGAKLEQLIPCQPPSLIHGDLWSGNVLFDHQGNAVLIDPACHFGWAEAELAMTSLFGGFPGEFYDAYENERPEVSGWRDRAPIYNLYHLLNHANLFGGSYPGQVESIVSRYC